MLFLKNNTFINNSRLKLAKKQSKAKQHPETELSKSRHQRYPIMKDVLRNFAKLIGKQLCQSPFFNKVVGLRPAVQLY